MAKHEPQRIKIFNHMKKYGSITTMEAFNLYHITRLSGRIYDLRHDDGCIIDQIRHNKVVDGIPVKWDEFFISDRNEVIPTW